MLPRKNLYLFSPLSALFLSFLKSSYLFIWLSQVWVTACGFFPRGPTGKSPFITCFKSHSVSSVQSLSHVQLFATPGTAAHQASLSITNSQSLLKFMSITSVMPPNHLILCCPLLLLPSIFPSITVFSNESVLHIRWPRSWSFSFSISSSNEYSGLISFRINWFDLLAVQRTLKSLLQHHSSKTPILWCSAFFMVQLSHPYVTTGKTCAIHGFLLVIYFICGKVNMSITVSPKIDSCKLYNSVVFSIFTKLYNHCHY